MNVFDLYAKISLDTSEYESGLEGASGKTSSFGSGIKSAFSTIASVGAVALTAATTAVVAFGKSAIEAGSNFDTSMSQLAATMGTTVDQIQNLRDKAMEMGAATSFSASEAADGLNILAMAGLTAEEQIVAIGTVLDLAAAGAISMADAASYAVGAVKGFGDGVGNAQYYADLMAKGATLANTSVQGLGEAMSMSAATAHSYGQQADSVTLSLLRLAEQNITGSEAATALNRAMADLYAPTDAAKKALNELGVSAYDSSGAARDFNDVVDDLSAALSGYTAEEATAYAATIFTTQGLNAFNKMTATSADTLDRFRDGLANSLGSAAEQAATQLDNLSGDVTIFKSALEGAQIVVADKLMPTLREFVQFGTEGLSDVTNAFKEDGLSGAMEAFGTFLSDALNMMISTLPKMVDAGAQLLGAVGHGIISNLPQIMDAAIQVATMFAGYIIDAAPSVISAAAQIISSLMDGITAAIPELLPAALQAVDEIANGLIDNAPMLIDSALQLIVTLGEGIISALPDLATKIPEIITTIVDTLTESFPDVLAAGVQLLGALVDAIPTVVTNLLASLPQLVTSITGFLTSNVPLVVDAAVTLLNGLVEAIPQVIAALVAALPDIITSIVNYLTENYPVMLEAAIQLYMALIEAIPQIIVSLLSSLPEIFDTIVTSIIESGPDVLDAAVQMFMNIVNAIPEFLGSLVEGLGSIGSTIIGWLTGTGSEVAAIAKGTTDDVVDSYNTMGSQLDSSLSGTESNVTGHFNSLNSSVSGSLDGTVSAANTKFGQINTDIDGSVSKSKTTVESGFSDIKTSISDKTDEAAADVEEKYSAINTTIDEKIKASKLSVDDNLGLMKTSFSDGLSGMLTNTESVFDSIHTAMADTMAEAYESVQSAIDKIRGAFNFEWSLPYLKLPHIQIHGEFSLETPSAPTFSVSWYRKAMNMPMLLNGATIFGAMGGKLLGGGESGSEIVAGTDTLMGMIREASSGGNEEELSLLRRIAEGINSNGTVINLMAPDGTKFASYLFNPLAQYAKANGTPIINPT